MQNLGQEGELTAAIYLEKQGFKVLARNYRCRLGEVDLIVENKKKDLLFVEVKTRRTSGDGASVSPLEIISYQKKRHISRVAQNYLAAKRLHDRNADFAVLIVHWEAQGPRFEFIQEAFELAWGY